MCPREAVSFEGRESPGLAQSPEAHPIPPRAIPDIPLQSRRETLRPMAWKYYAIKCICIQMNIFDHGISREMSKRPPCSVGSNIVD